MKNNAGTWPLSRLKDVIIDMQPGFAQRPNVENIGTPQLRTNNISPQGSLDLSDIVNVKVTPSELEKYGVRQGDVIFNNTNSVEWVGKTAYFDRKGDYVLSNHMTRVRPNPSLLDAEFLARYLHYLWQIRISAHRAKQWVNQAAIDQTMLAQFEIPLPPLPEQRRIVTILRQADKLRQLRREADERAQQLLLALFYEMFGDPVANPKGWKLFTLESLLSPDRKGITTGPFGSILKRGEYVQTGIPVWGINNVQPNEFVESELSFITTEKYQTLIEYSVEEGDILISRAGTVGRICVAYPSYPESIIGTNLIRVVLDKSKIHPEYFSAILTFFPDRLGNLRASGDEASYSFLNPKSLRSLKFPLPSLVLQKEFFRRIQEIRRARMVQKESSQHLYTLFQSLLTQAFSGELTAAWCEQHRDEDETTRIFFEEDLEAASTLHVVPSASFEDSLEVSDTVRASSTPRPELTGILSDEQWQLFKVISSTEGYFTVETLRLQVGLPLHVIRQGVQLFASLGLIQAVRLPDRPMRNVLVYVPAYRNLAEADRAKELDLDLLARSITSTLHGFDPLESEVLP